MSACHFTCCGCDIADAQHFLGVILTQSKPLCKKCSQISQDKKAVLKVSFATDLLLNVERLDG